MTMMFFLVPSSRQTRRTIWSGVSVKMPGVPSRENRLRELAGADLLAELEGVKVGDDDPGLAELFKLVAGDDVAKAVVIVGVVGEQDAQTVADGDAGADDQERVGETGVLVGLPAC